MGHCDVGILFARKKVKLKLMASFSSLRSIWDIFMCLLAQIHAPLSCYLSSAS